MQASLSPEAAARFAGLALDCVGREYPNKLALVLAADGDAKPPRELTPSFYGCFDWHSAVHGHWMLARLAKAFPEASFTADARAALADALQPDKVAAEVAFIGRPDRIGFERPYGLAWLLQLAAELRDWDDPEAKGWAETLAPLEALAAQRLRTWIPKLSFPIRGGEHSQTAFAFGLAWDWALARGDREMLAVLKDAADRFYREDRSCPIAYEPSGHDFLSPCLAEADFMRRVMPQPEFRDWLRAALPTIPTGREVWIQPAVPSDRSDGKLAHLDGLNLSRAWMLRGVAQAVGHADARAESLQRTASAHAEAGLAAVTGEHYAGGHWLASFATYYATERGLTAEGEQG